MQRNPHFCLKVSNFIAVMVALYTAYYLLLHDSFLHSSIACILSHANHLAIQAHLVILGLLPIYIALMIFGAAMVGIFMGPRLEYIVARATGCTHQHLR